MCKKSDCIIKIKVFVCILLLFSIFFLYFDCHENQASEVNDVTVSLIEKKDLGNGNYYIHLKTNIYNKALYNDSLKLSYHVFDKNGNIVQFENERYGLVMDSDGEIQDIYLDVKLEKPRKDVEIQFDIVDEMNNFWFNDSEVITGDIYKFKHNYSFFDNLLVLFKLNIVDYTTLFGINVIVFIMSIIAIIYIKHKEES